MQLEAEKRRPQSRGRPTLGSSVQLDYENRNDLVATIDDDDLVADHEVPESSPLGVDAHDDGRDFDHPHARWHRGTHAHREVDVAGPRYIAAGQDRLSNLGALLRRQGRASARLTLLTLLSLAGLSLPLLTGLALLTLLSLRGLPLSLVSLLALRLRLLVLLPLALSRGLIALLFSLATLLGLTLLAAILLRALITLTLGRLARGLALLSALRLALLLFLRALLRLPFHVLPALGLAARSGL
jgi:hypothetical protein